MTHSIRHKAPTALRFTAALLLLLVAADRVHSAPTATKKTKRGDETVWAIGVYAGQSPFELQSAPDVNNPVLAPRDTAGAADTLAHPFMMIESDRFHLFFTAKNSADGTGAIGHAESVDGRQWTYRGAVLRETWALSYPCVFKWRDAYYLVPESKDDVIRLYRTTRFPDRWERVTELIKGDKLVSPSVVRHGGAWWMFLGSGNATARLFRASELTGPWMEHPRSPIVANDPNSARPAGRPLSLEGRLYRLAQGCEPTYGNAVRAFKITVLTATDYAEKPVEKPLVQASSAGWNAAAMHHVDAHRLNDGSWIAVVDARGAKVGR